MQAENPDENQKVGSDSDDTDEEEEGDGLVGRPPASSSPGAAAVGE